MELKLVAEIKEKADQKQCKNPKESPLDTLLAVSGISHDPVAQLVSELSQALHVEKEPEKKEEKDKNLVRKGSQGNIVPLTSKNTDNNGVTFVSQLKKAATKEKPDVNETPLIIDFKSRLRKVENSDKKEEDNEVETNKRESTASSDSGNLKIEEGDDKRKSTGSISSLKKLWESKDPTDNGANVQLSPKLSVKNNKDEIIETSPIESSDDSVKKKWPPNNDDKPIIPTKPPVKAVKPTIARTPGSAIYATPNAKPPISAKPTLDNKTPEEETKNNASDKTGKDNILEISQTLETTLNTIKTNPSVSSATWLQVSDKIGLLHGSCMDYADNVVPPHAKFQFRELLTRLESQALQLRSAGSRNTTENRAYINEVSNTIKDVVNVVFR